MKPDSELLAEAIDRDPFDDTARCAFQDALMEGGLHHTLAAEVAHVRQVHSRLKWQHARAAAFMRTRHRTKRAFVVELRSRCGLAPDAVFHIMVAEGENHPRYYDPCWSDERGCWTTGTIVVGAGWVLKWRDEYSKWLLTLGDKRRRARDAARRRRKRYAK